LGFAWLSFIWFGFIAFETLGCIRAWDYIIETIYACSTMLCESLYVCILLFMQAYMSLRMELVTFD
jgi:hypothetical protein